MLGLAEEGLQQIVEVQKELIGNLADRIGETNPAK